MYTFWHCVSVCACVCIKLMAFLHMEIISKLICKNSTVFNSILHSMSSYLNSYMRMLLFKSCTSLTQISTICHFYLPHNTLNLIRSCVFTTLFYGTEGCLKTGITSYLLPCLKYIAGNVHPISTYLVSSYRMSFIVPDDGYKGNTDSPRVQGAIYWKNKHHKHLHWKPESIVCMKDPVYQRDTWHKTAFFKRALLFWPKLLFYAIIVREILK